MAFGGFNRPPAKIITFTLISVIGICFLFQISWTPTTSTTYNFNNFTSNFSIFLSNQTPIIRSHISLSKNYIQAFWESVDPGAGSNNYNFLTDQIIRLDLWKTYTESSIFDEDRWIAQKLWQMKAENISILKVKKPKLILVWADEKYTGWWGEKTWIQKDRKLDKALMDPSIQCPQTPNSIGHCEFTGNKKLAKNADVVLLKIEDFAKNKAIQNLPKHVLKIIYNLESTRYTPSIVLNTTTDILASYWSGSQIVTPYFKWMPFDPLILIKEQNLDYSVGKTKPGAIVMSNCNAINNRLGFIKKMQKYIQIDVYGGCGKFNCTKRKECFKDLGKDYFFYFAFENSNCRDYITEKFFKNALKQSMVPVVLGAHPIDYAAIAPFNSYIHVEDFKGPEELAAYLNHLIEHPQAYNEYFKWRDTGRLIPWEIFCRVCAMAHYSTIVPPVNLNFKWDPKTSVKSRNVSSSMSLENNKWYWTK